MRYFVRSLVDRKIVFRSDAGAWSRFDAGVWIPVERVDVERFLLDPFVAEVSADQAREILRL